MRNIVKRFLVGQPWSLTVQPKFDPAFSAWLMDTFPAVLTWTDREGCVRQIAFRDEEALADVLAALERHGVNLEDVHDPGCPDRAQPQT